MKLNDEQLSALWQTAASAKADCLSEALLLRAGADDLTSSEREQLAAHLAGCTDCVEAYRIARSAYAWANEAAPSLAPQPATQPVIGWRERFAGWFGLLTSGPSFALATALALAVLGFGVWTNSLTRERQALQARLKQQQDELAQVPALQAQINELQTSQTQSQTTRDTFAAENKRLNEELIALTQPQLEVPIVDADPTSLMRGGGQSTLTRIEVPPSAALFTVILHLSDPARKDLLIVWRDAQTKKELWRREVKKGDAHNLTLTLARRNIPAGKYRVAITTAKGVALDHFDIEVIYPSATKK
jgi:hypothetical protein